MRDIIIAKNSNKDLANKYHIKHKIASTEVVLPNIGKIFFNMLSPHDNSYPER
jgi:hypothetical protein